MLEMPKIKYIVHPGVVRSKLDGKYIKVEDFNKYKKCAIVSLNGEKCQI